MTDGIIENNVQSETQAPASIEQNAPTERTFRQSEVNELIGRVKHETEQKVLRRQQESNQNQANSYRHDDGNSRQSNSLNEDSIRRMAAEEAQRLRDNWLADAQSRNEQEYAQRTVSNFWDKVNQGKTKYDDFDKVTGDIEYSRFPNVVQLLAEHLDNSGDVLYDLGKNRLKLSQLEQLAQLSPRDAIVEAKRLSESIRNNEEASKMRQPNAPLSQQRPSYVGTDAGSTLSMRDLKAKYRV